MSMKYADAGATIKRNYRYRLWRRWDLNGSTLVWIMLNPSTADALTDDATIRRCIGFAKQFGHGGIEVVNLFAYRATNPKRLKLIEAPVGPDNNGYILKACQGSQVVCAWGNHGMYHNRGDQVTRMLFENNIPMWMLGKTKEMQPKHPLYVPRGTELQMRL